jgi:hypothetical protein
LVSDFLKKYILIEAVGSRRRGGNIGRREKMRKPVLAESHFTKETPITVFAVPHKILMSRYCIVDIEIVSE